MSSLTVFALHQPSKIRQARHLGVLSSKNGSKKDLNGRDPVLSAPLERAIQRDPCLDNLPLTDSNLRQDVETNRDLQSTRCWTPYVALFEDNPVLNQTNYDLWEAGSSAMKECNENPCILYENDKEYEPLVDAHRDACFAANGTLYEYDVYLYCESENFLNDNRYLNLDYCFPSAFWCPPWDVDRRVYNLLDQQADFYRNDPDENYTCYLDIDFVRSETSAQGLCNDKTEAVFEKRPSLGAAADELIDSFNEAYYDNCTADKDCLVDENQLEGSKEYVDECIAADGRIYEYNFYIGCSNSQTEATKNATILGFDGCFSRVDCPSTITESLVRQDMRTYADELEDELGNGWTCSYRRVEQVAVYPGPAPPPRPSRGSPTSSSVNSARSTVFSVLVLSIGALVVIN